jgi:hypothetical protein
MPAGWCRLGEQFPCTGSNMFCTMHCTAAQAAVQQHSSEMPSSPGKKVVLKFIQPNAKQEKGPSSCSCSSASPADLLDTFITTPSFTCCVQRASASCCLVPAARTCTALPRLLLLLLPGAAAARGATRTQRTARAGAATLRPLAAAAALLVMRELHCARAIAAVFTEGLQVQCGRDSRCSSEALLSSCTVGGYVLLLARQMRALRAVQGHLSVSTAYTRRLSSNWSRS